MQEMYKEGIVCDRVKEAARTVIFGNQPPLHQGPAVRGEPGVEARHPRTQKELDEKDAASPARREDPARGPGIAPCQLPEVERGPDQPAKREKRCEQVDGKPEVTHIGHRSGKSAAHHEPAEHALEPTQGQQRHQPPFVALRDRATYPEPGERQRKGQSDQAAQQAVKPLPEKDELEGGEIHARWSGDMLVFAGGLIKIEFGLPRAFRKRRDGTGNRFPLGDRQAAFGQTCDTAHGDHQDNHRRDDE